MKKLLKKFLLSMELVAYHRVLNECHSMLTDEHRQNIHRSIAKAKEELSA